MVAYHLIVTLGAKTVLSGILLTLSVLGALALASGHDRDDPIACTRVLPSVARDADAQSIVENLARAAPVIAQARDIELYAVKPYYPPSSSEFYFIRENYPRPFALLVYDDRPVPSNLTEIRALDFRQTARPVATLDDLTLGSIRAVMLVEDEYPAFNLQTVTLFRDDDCRLVWRVGGTIDEEGRPSLLLKAFVYSNGDVRLLDGPPLPYENLLDILSVNW